MSPETDATTFSAMFAEMAWQWAVGTWQLQFPVPGSPFQVPGFQVPSSGGSGFRVPEVQEFRFEFYHRSQSPESRRTGTGNRNYRNLEPGIRNLEQE
jgi:hypothetical protein